MEGTEGDVPVPASRLSPTAVSEVAIRVVVAGLPAALLATFSAAENVPAVVDAKVTVMEQFAPMARVDPQVLPVMLKSLWFAPVNETLLIFTGDDPVLVSVAVCAWFELVRALKFNDEVIETSVCAPGLSPTKPAFSMAEIGVITGPAIPTR
jgi:hypothetical protein